MMRGQSYNDNADLSLLSGVGAAAAVALVNRKATPASSLDDTVMANTTEPSEKSMSYEDNESAKPADQASPSITKDKSFTVSDSTDLPMARIQTMKKVPEQATLPLLVELFLPRQCNLTFESNDTVPGLVMNSQPDPHHIKRLLSKTRLSMPCEGYALKKLGAVSLRTNSGLLVSSLLFERDKSSAFAKIFDVVRLATEPDWQRKGCATHCLNTCVFLLRQNFPHDRIFIRAGVLKRKNAEAFYEKAGFTRGVFTGLSNPYCGRLDCIAYHLEVNGPKKLKKRHLAKSEGGKKVKENPLYAIEAFVSKPSFNEIEVKWVGTRTTSMKSEEELREELDPVAFARMKNLLLRWSAHVSSCSDINHDDDCMVCNDGGDLICCETCPCVVHPSCILLRNTSHKWRCAICRHNCPNLRLSKPIAEASRESGNNPSVSTAPKTKRVTVDRAHEVEAFVSKPSSNEIEVKWVGTYRTSMKLRNELREELDSPAFTRMESLLDRWPSCSIQDYSAVSCSDLNYDYECMVCDDGGDLICCETCPCVAHPSCIKLSNVSHLWRCAICRHQAPNIRLSKPIVETSRESGNNPSGNTSSKTKRIKVDRASVEGSLLSKQVYQKIKLGKISGYPVVVTQGKSEHHAILTECGDNPQDFLRGHNCGKVKVRWESTRCDESVPTSSVHLIEIDAALPARKVAKKHLSLGITKEASMNDAASSGESGAHAETQTQYQNQNTSRTYPPDSQLLLILPKIEVFCSQHSQLVFKDVDVGDSHISVVETKDGDAIKHLLNRDSIDKFNKKSGWISLRRRPSKLDCDLLFERDDSLSTLVYDIASFHLGGSQENYVDARHCLHVFMSLLHKNFPRQKVIVRAAVVRRAQSFYKDVGFVQGLPFGLPMGKHCGYIDCTTFHLIVEDFFSKKANRKRREVAEKIDSAAGAYKIVKVAGSVARAVRVGSKVLTGKRERVVVSAKTDDFAWEEEYRKLHDYYLKPVTRENEELPTGMIIRRTEAKPSLIRCKNSEFRHRLHEKILHLERLGERKEIHRILKMLSDHDMKCLGGGDDGPKALMEEIFPIESSAGMVVSSKPFNKDTDNEVDQHYVDYCSISDDGMNEHGDDRSTVGANSLSKTNGATSDLRPEICLSTHALNASGHVSSFSDCACNKQEKDPEANDNAKYALTKIQK